jgi:hypothetical protein
MMPKGLPSPRARSGPQAKAAAARDDAGKLAIIAKGKKRTAGKGRGCGPALVCSPITSFRRARSCPGVEREFRSRAPEAASIWQSVRQRARIMFWFAPVRMRGRLPLMTGTIRLGARAPAAQQGRFPVGAEGCGAPRICRATERTQGMVEYQRLDDLPMHLQSPLLAGVSG